MDVLACEATGPAVLQVGGPTLFAHDKSAVNRLNASCWLCVCVCVGGVGFVT